MKISIDKGMTTLEKLARTREQAKEFKAANTDGDLLRMFHDALEHYEISGDILRCDASAFPGGTMETDENHYAVDMIVMGYNSFWKIRFYISQSCEIDTRTVWAYDHYMDMWTIEEYKKPD